MDYSTVPGIDQGVGLEQRHADDCLSSVRQHPIQWRAGEQAYAITVVTQVHSAPQGYHRPP
jgi:hypothetical protein